MDKLPNSREAFEQKLDELLSGNPASVRSLMLTLFDVIIELREENRELKARLNQNSHNSSKPPSSDGLRKPQRPNLRSKTGKKRGGQFGHKGKTLQFVSNPTKVELHMAKDCEGCPHAAECRRTYTANEPRQVTDISFTVSVVEHRLVDVPNCLRRGGRMVGEFPQGVNSPLQYGSNLLALCAVLNTEGAMSVNRVSKILGGAFNVSLSPATVLAATRKCAEAVDDVYNEIGARIANEPLAHFDETSVRIDGKNHWAHVAATRDYTHLAVSVKRGSEGMREAGVLPFFNGIAVTDCWQSYWRFPNVVHATCGVHLLRELIGVIENDDKQSWAIDFKKLLKEMKTTKDDLLNTGILEATSEQKRKFSDNYDELLKHAREENPDLSFLQKGKRGRKKKGKVLALIERLENLKDAVCRFFNDFFVPFDNNEGERSCRIFKVKTKIAGCFRTVARATDFANVLSYTATGKKRGHSAFESICLALQGKPESVLAFCN